MYTNLLVVVGVNGLFILRLVVVVVNMLFIYDLSNSPASPSHVNFHLPLARIGTETYVVITLKLKTHIAFAVLGVGRA